MKSIAVLYHAGCSDGFGAALAAWKKLGRGSSYIPIEPGILPPKPIRARKIYVLDSSLRKNDFKKLRKENKEVIVIDHHASNEKDMRFASSYFFDIKHSAAVLSWMYFHPSKKVPRFFKHIEDRDLWKFKLPHTREIGAFIDLMPHNFKKWSKIVSDFEKASSKKIMIQKGKIILDYEKRLLESLLKNAELVKFQGYKTWAVNSPFLESQAGNIMCKKFPPIAIIWRQKHGIRTFSLRSNGKVDVSKLAARFGGGGHKTSAGFRMSAAKKLPWKYLGNVQK